MSLSFSFTCGLETYNDGIGNGKAFRDTNILSYLEMIRTFLLVYGNCGT